MAGTLGERKGGMALSYKGIWGYAPLIIIWPKTANLYPVNRPGKVVSHEGCDPWIERVIELVRPRAAEITQDGKTDFRLSAEGLGKLRRQIILKWMFPKSSSRQSPCQEWLENPWKRLAVIKLEKSRAKPSGQGSHCGFNSHV